MTDETNTDDEENSEPRLPGECPGGCGNELTEDDKEPILGLFMCDDCEKGYNAGGAVVAK